MAERTIKEPPSAPFMQILTGLSKTFEGLYRAQGTYIQKAASHGATVTELMEVTGLTRAKVLAVITDSLVFEDTHGFLRMVDGDLMGINEETGQLLEDQPPGASLTDEIIPSVRR